ncbi:MAG: glycoside hydrolase family 2 TIM barrel-domain containing protein [Candidatus Omnitrophota bacterium]
MIMKWLLMGVSFLLCFGSIGWAGGTAWGNVVKVTGNKGSWVLTVNGQPYYIKGAGVAHATSDDKGVDFLKLAQAMGANTVRNWGVGQWGKDYLDRAHAYGLMVDAGFWLNPAYPDGTCSYLTDRVYMEEMRQQVLTYVKEYQDHPAVLAWNIGNETIYWTKDEKERIGFCTFLEKLIQEVHQIDPDHPVIYTSAYTTDAEYIFKYVPSLDILGINVYGAVEQTHRVLKAKQNIPFIFTEVGPPGPWDLPKDARGRPLELTDQEKASAYEQQARAVFEHKGYNLGGFAFTLGETTQTALTWWNVNFGETSKLSYIKLRDVYTGKVDDAHRPFIKSLSLSKEDGIYPGEEIRLSVDVQGASKDVVYAYMVSTEVDSDLVENPNKRIMLKFDNNGNTASVRVPSTPGIYRVYGIISDPVRKYSSTLSRTMRVVGKD